MKTKILLCTTTFCLWNLFATAQYFQWARGVGGTSNDNGKSVSVDNTGNIYVAGDFTSPTIVFGSTTLTNTGSADVFLVKYDAGGNVLWATSATGSSFNYAYGVTTDCGPGNVIITGAFGGSITFGAFTLTAAAGGADIFVVQYDAAGNVMWAKSATGASDDFAYSVATDYGCNVYITGYFNSPTLTFGSTTLTNTTTGFNNVFLAKYDMSGNEVWARSAGGSGNLLDIGKCVAYNNNGVYISGNYNNSITFGTTTLTSVGGDDAFLANYDTNGNLVWAKSIGGTLDETGVGIAANSNAKDVYVTGNFNSPTCFFGAASLANSSPGPAFYYDDIFISKYDSVGNVVWLTRAGGQQQDRAGGITMDVLQNVYATGVFWDTISFGATTLISSGGNTEIYVAKCDSAGNQLWAIQAGGSSDEKPTGIDVHHYNTFLYITGEYNSSPSSFGTNNLSNSGADDFFLSQVYDLTVPVETPTTVIDFRIYPNPSLGLVTVITPFKEGVITMYNMLGETVSISGVNNSGVNTIDLSEQPDGIYFIRICNQEMDATERLILQH